MQRTRTFWKRLAAIALLGAIVAAAATWVDAEERGGIPRWRVPGAPLPRTDRNGGCGPRGYAQVEFFPVELPEARHARARFRVLDYPMHMRVPDEIAEEAEAEQRVLTVMVAADGRVYVDSREFDLDAEDEQQRRSAAWALESAVASRPLPQDEVPRHAVALNVDRRTPWRFVRGCLLGAAHPRNTGVDRVQLSVRRDARHSWRFMPLRIKQRGPDEALAWDRAASAIERSEAATTMDPPAIRMSRAGAGDEAQTVIRFGTSTFTFPVGDRLRDAGFVRAANATWGAFEARVQGLSQEPFVTVLLDDAADVPWAYVVGLLDVLADVGVKRVNVPAVPRARVPGRGDRQAGVLPPYGPPADEAGLGGLLLSFEPLPDSGTLPTPDCSPVSREGPHWLWLLLAGVGGAGVALVGRLRQRSPAG